MRVDLRLRDSGELNLDRILDGGNVDAGRVDLVQRGVERGRFAGAGGAGDEDDAVGILDEALERLEDGLRDHHLIQREHGFFPAHGEDADDDFLAVGRGNRGHAEVRRLRADGHGETAVLRETRLGDVERAEDFYARDESAVELARVGEDFTEVAIDAEADAALGFHRLDVDVGRAFAHAVINDLVENLNEGVVLREMRELLAGVLEVVEEAGAAEFVEAVLDVFLGAVMNRDRVLDLARQSENGADGNLRDLAEALDEIGIRGIGHGGGEHAVDDVEPDGLGFLGDLEGEFFHGFLGDRGGKGIDVGDVHRVCPDAADVLLRRDFVGDERLHEFDAGAVPGDEAGGVERSLEVGQRAEVPDEIFNVGTLHGGGLSL